MDMTNNVPFILENILFIPEKYLSNVKQSYISGRFVILVHY